MYTMLKAYRAAYKKNQKDIADILEISVPTYSKKETGKVPFLLPEAKTLADHFNTTIEHLFFGQKLHATKDNIAERKVV